VAQYSKRPPVNETTRAQGKAMYDRSCALCHGVKGEGDGPAAVYLARDFAPRPRVFADGVFKFRSTPSGELPTDEDLFRTVTAGVRGFMPPFTGLGVADRWKIIYFVKGFFPGFENANPQPVPIVGYPKPMTPASAQRGYQVYQKLQCFACHGGGGRGDGGSAPTLRDDWGFLIAPADLTRPASFKNGDRPEDIYRTLVTGMNGSPMPSYEAFFEGNERDLWDLVNYILSLSQERRP
jgi:cytochrome c oxidase cbb3-type subunit I/II